METAPTNTKIFEPLGDLSVFPREIRDEIYRRVFPSSKKYTAFYSSSICRPFDYEQPDRDWAHIDFKRKEWIGSDFSILRLSKAIKDEAMPLLYSEGTFCFCGGLNPDNIDVLQHRNADVINRMTNIELFLRAAYVPELLAATESYYGAGAGPLEFFQGVSVMRKSIFIMLVLFDDEWLDDATAMVAWRLSKILGHLTGFQTVKIRLIASYTSCRPPQETAGTTVNRGFEPLLSALSQDLEPTLGNSSVMSELLSPEETESGYSGQWLVTFHPRDHLAAISKAKKDVMEWKHSKGTKWINE